jgi:hypothetical protein
MVEGTELPKQTGTAMAMRYYAPFPGDSGVRQPHALRIGNAERDAAAADLSEHYAAGRLTFDELSERLDAVFSAKTFGQLMRIMADLPGPGRLPWPSGYWPVVSPAQAGHGWTPAVTEESATSSDRAGRIAAVSLLLLAMLIWLFTALLFARQGFYHPGGPYPYGPPMNHSAQHISLMPDYQPTAP